MVPLAKYGSLLYSVWQLLPDQYICSYRRASSMRNSMKFGRILKIIQIFTFFQLRCKVMLPKDIVLIDPTLKHPGRGYKPTTAKSQEEVPEDNSEDDEDTEGLRIDLESTAGMEHHTIIIGPSLPGDRGPWRQRGWGGTHCRYVAKGNNCIPLLFIIKIIRGCCWGGNMI